MNGRLLFAMVLVGPSMLLFAISGCKKPNTGEEPEGAPDMETMEKLDSPDTDTVLEGLDEVNEKYGEGS